jgi:hypothetical protein
MPAKSDEAGEGERRFSVYLVIDMKLNYGRATWRLKIC